jgi:predicted 3-demethylubiquinone-9 3-methyltransferase (glyoxalase superfamily)
LFFSLRTDEFRRGVGSTRYREGNEEDPVEITQKITPCLWFDNQAEEAVQHYVSIFPDARIVDVLRHTEASPGEPGTVLFVSFELAGQRFGALNGGPHDAFNDAISLQVSCETQAEVDELWEKLTAEGGRESECGWLKDKYGVSWQITPRQLMELITDKDPARAARAMTAMLGMKKIDIQGLVDAANAA